MVKSAAKRRKNAAHGASRGGQNKNLNKPRRGERIVARGRIKNGRAQQKREARRCLPQPKRQTGPEFRPRADRPGDGARCRREDRPRILALARRTRRQRRLPGSPAPRIPQRRLRMGRLRLAPRVPQGNGRVARPRRNDRMRASAARAHRSLCAPAGKRHTRPPHVLRHGEYAGRIRRPTAGRKPARPSDEDRRQRPAPGLARRHRYLCAGFDSRPVRSRPPADRHVDGRSSLGRGISPPTLPHQRGNSLKRYPRPKGRVSEPVNRDNVLEGAKLAFGQPVETRYDFSKADVIVSLDADFLYAGFPGNTRYIRDFASRRNPDSSNMNRLYVIESTPSSTGAKADHRLAVRADVIETCAAVLSKPNRIAIKEVTAAAGEAAERFFYALSQDLQRSVGSSLVLAGDHQPPHVHALAHVINAQLGNVGKTVFYTDPVDANPINQTESLKDLVADMRGGKVDLLVIFGGNPAYDAPADLNFADALKSGKTPLRVHYGLYQNETAELCQWHVNATHELEAWGDARAYDGTVSIIQPLIAPLYNGKSALEFIALLSGQADAAGYDLVRAYWQKQNAGADFEQFWRKSLHDGWIEGTAFQPKSVAAKADHNDRIPLAGTDAIELNIRRDP